MTTPWGFEDFDAHEDLHFITNEECGLKAIIAVHSTHLGPAAGGCRFWRYEDEAQAVTDALWKRDVIPDYRDPHGLRIGLSPLSTSFDEVRHGMAAVREELERLG